MWYQRVEKPDGTFVYIDVDTQDVLDSRTELERIDQLHIPRAYQNVMIHKNRRAKIQAYGYDARGRKQVKYAPWFIERQAKKKYEKVVEMDEYMPKLIEKMKHDLVAKSNGDGKSKTVAVILYLMIACGFRVGNEKYYLENQSYGLTTLEVRHIQHKLRDKSIHIRFVGKKGVENFGIVHKQDAPLVYRFLLKAVANRQPNDRVFVGISSDDVNGYLRQIHPDMTSKDIRTWNANNVFLSHIMETKASVPDSSSKINRTINTAIDKVAQHLHHTRDVCKKNYLHPDLINYARIVVVQREMPSISQAFA